MSDLAWAAIAVVMLVIVGVVFVYVWHGGERPNGLKGELQERVTALEHENVVIWQELKRLEKRVFRDG